MHHAGVMHLALTPALRNIIAGLRV